MKKKKFMWLSMLFLAAVCVGFASCGDDDDDGNGVITGGGMELPKNVTLVKTTVPADENSTREIEFFTLQDGTGYYNAEYNRYTAIPRPDLSPTSLDAASYYVFPFFEVRYSRTDGEPNIFSHDTNENFNVVYDEQNGRYVVRDDYGVMTYWRVLSKSDTQCQISKVDDSGTIVNTETFEIRKVGSEYSKMTYWEYNNQTPIADDKVSFIGADETISQGSSASLKTNSRGIWYTNYITIDIYSDEYFSIDQIESSTSASWLSVVDKTILWYKGPVLDSYNEATRVMVYWATTSNSGADRTGTITLKVKNVEGKAYSATYTVEQQGESNGGGGNGGNGGNGGSGGGTTDEWEAISAPGYLPYYYCPTDRTTTPSYPRSTTHTVYKNKNTGAYKITWAGVTYAAYRGSNKITIGRDSHTTYNATIKRWMPCTDYYYLEFTIY